MAIDSYMAFKMYSGGPGGTGNWLEAESQVDFSKNSETLFQQPIPLQQGHIFEVKEYSFDIEQQLNIGSASRGAGAGKVTFNPFSVTRSVDKQSPIFFQMACSGTPFGQVVLALRKSSGGDMTGQIFVRFDFKLVAVKTISWSHDDEAPSEEITFEYGGLQVRYAIQAASGAMDKVSIGGWNRVKNVADQGTTSIT